MQLVSFPNQGNKALPKWANPESWKASLLFFSRTGKDTNNLKGIAHQCNLVIRRSKEKDNLLHSGIDPVRAQLFIQARGW